MSANRLIWLDCLRLVAGVSMVLLHSTADSHGQAWPAYDMAERMPPLLLRSIVYVARTELFLIISAFLLLLALSSRPRTYKETMLEQARRLIVPFVFWTVFYAIYGLIKADAFGYLDSAIQQLFDPLAWVGFLLLGDVKYHMHFLPTLFGLLLFYPMFRIAVRHPILGLAVIPGLVLMREMETLIYQNYWGTDLLPYMLRTVKILSYIGYGLFAGAMLGIWQKSSPPKRAKAFSAILFLGCVLFAFKLSATWETITAGRWVFDNIAGYWADFLMPTVLFSGCLVLGHKPWPGVLSRIAPYSFGIYLCHPIFLDLCEVALHGYFLSPISQVALKISFTLTMTSVFVLWLARRQALAWTIGLGPLPFFENTLRHGREARS